jgi:3-mercaptopyruvate sulfurtransferase SseA
VGAAWVEQRLGSPALTILDLRPARRFRMGHLPGARNDPEGRTLLAAVLARRRPAAVSKPVALPTDPPGRTVVLVHGGHDLAERAAATRAYLAIYAAGASPGRLAILRGGYVSWRRQRRPRTTTKAPRPRTTTKAPGPRPRPQTMARAPRPRTMARADRTGPKTQPRPTAAPAPPSNAGARPHKPGITRPVLLTDPVALSTARKQPRTLLVHTGLRRPALRTGRPRPAWLRFGVAPLEPAPGAQPRSATELRQLLGPLLATRAKVRLIAFSKKGLWASLLWFTLKTRLNRPDALNAVYLGPALGR